MSLSIDDIVSMLTQDGKICVHINRGSPFHSISNISDKWMLFSEKNDNDLDNDTVESVVIKYFQQYFSYLSTTHWFKYDREKPSFERIEKLCQQLTVENNVIKTSRALITFPNEDIAQKIATVINAELKVIILKQLSREYC